ncbi:uncharacterized protein LOC142912124 [Petromyzon marinus]|uniref:uncharacterized protein LOC142912124 n=1 Tax=Petromyzon marinus TaxID=7757 RepID=UPI003F6FB681
MSPQTVRLKVNYSRARKKTVVLASPRVALQALLPDICNECELDVHHTALFGDASETELLDTSCSLSELGVKEVYAVDRSRELGHDLNDNADLPEKKHKGLWSFLRPKIKKSPPGQPRLAQETGRSRSPPPAPLASPSTRAAGATSPLGTLRRRTKPRAPPPPPPPPSTTARGTQAAGPEPPPPLPRSAPEQARPAALLLLSQPGSTPPVQPGVENERRRRSSSAPSAQSSGRLPLKDENEEETSLNEGAGMGGDPDVTRQQPEASSPRTLEQGPTAKSETQKTFCVTSQQAGAVADNAVQGGPSDLAQADAGAAATAELDELIAELEIGLTTDDDSRSKSGPRNVETVKINKTEADVDSTVEPVKKPEPALPDSTVMKATADSSSDKTDKVDVNDETNANVATDVNRGPSEKPLQFLKARDDVQRMEAADGNEAGNAPQVSAEPPVTQTKNGNEAKVDFLAKVRESALAQQLDRKSKPALCGSFTGATAEASGCVVGEQDPGRKRLPVAFPDTSTKPNSELSRAGRRGGGSLKCLDKMPVKNETFLNAHVEKIPVVHAKSVDKQVKSIPVERQDASSEQHTEQLVTRQHKTHVEESVLIQPVEIRQEIAGAREEIVEPDKVCKVIAEARLTKSEKVSEINETSQPVMDQSNEPGASMQNRIFHKTRSISKERRAPEVECQNHSAETSSPVFPVCKQPSDRWRSTNEITRDYLPKVGLTTYRIVPSKPVIRPKPGTADVPFLLPAYKTEPGKTENATATNATKEIKETLKYYSTAKIGDITTNPQQHTAHQSPVIPLPLIPPPVIPPPLIPPPVIPPPLIAPPVIPPPLIPPPVIPPPLIPPPVIPPQLSPPPVIPPPLIPPPVIPPPMIPHLSGLSIVARPFQRSHSLQCTTEAISQQHSATEPLASTATSPPPLPPPPSSSKQDAFFRPGRRASSIYVASAIAKRTAYKAIDAPNETYSGTTTTNTTPVHALPPIQVNWEQDELTIPPPPQFSMEENANIPNAPGDPGKVIIITEAPRVHQWKPKLFRPVSFPSVMFKNDKPSSVSVASSHSESKNAVFPVKSPPPVSPKPSSGNPFNVKSATNSSQIQSVLSSPKSTDASPFHQPPTVLNTTGTALESLSLIHGQRKPSGEDSGPFGPMLKLKPVVQTPIVKDNNAHGSLMEALQSTDNVGTLRKVSGEHLQAMLAAVDSEAERDARISAAVPSGAGGKRLRKTPSAAAAAAAEDEELVSQQLREADSGDSATVRPRLAPVHSPPVPIAPPPPVILVGNGATGTERRPEDARLAMLDAIRSGSCAGMPKKVIVTEPPRVHQWKPKPFRPVSFPSVLFKDDEPSSVSVASSHSETKNAVFPVKSPPPVSPKPSSGNPFNVKSASNSSQIQSVLSSPKSAVASPFHQPPTVSNTTGTAPGSPSLIHEQRKPSGEDSGPFGPMLKSKPVVQKPKFNVTDVKKE